jgi:hypothetical protein
MSLRAHISTLLRSEQSELTEQAEKEQYSISVECCNQGTGGSPEFLEPPIRG